MGNLANRFRQIPNTAETKQPARKPAIKLVKESREPTTGAKRGPKPSGKAKKLVTIRLDQALIEHYRAMGEGWQTKINDDLLRLNDLQ